MALPILFHTQRISGPPTGYEEVRSISKSPADVCSGGGFKVNVFGGVHFQAILTNFVIEL